MRRALAYAVLLSLLPLTAGGANLDVSASYKLRAVSYSNLELRQNQAGSNKHSFLSDDARLAVGVRKIKLPARAGGEDVTMDLGLVLHAIGVAGSTASVASPFSRAALYYPRTDQTPFLENAYMRVRGLWGLPVEYTLGRQTYRLGSGLLLDDDGAGLTGFSARGELPWWGMKAEGFVFADRNPLNTASPNPVTFFGAAVDLPTEGTWQLMQLFEKDGAGQLVYGCDYAGNPDTAAGCRVSKALRSFTAVRYQISYGPLVFDGEAALQKGVATPTGGVPAPTHVTYNGNAQVVKMKWKQRLYKSGEGIARVSVARGSGDKAGTTTTDEAFFPTRGHRHNGLERSGFGEFFNATPYDAYGGNYSSTTASGLPAGLSGIMVVGAGYTPPAYRGFALDVDYFLYQAERVNRGASRTLGMEWDVRLRYPLMDQLQLSATMAYFKAGTVIDPSRSVSRKYSFEVSGRF